MQLDSAAWIESEPAPALLVSSNGQIVIANHALARLIGVLHAQLADASLFQFLDEPRAKVEGYLRLCGRNRDIMPGAFTWLTSAGERTKACFEGRLIQPRGTDSPAVVILVCRPQDDVAQQFLLLNEKIEALSREISARRRMEEEREDLLAKERAARHEAERVSRVKDEFLATLSHELRTPLNAILGWTQILRMGGPDDSNHSSGLEVIERNTRLQVKLIEDLLDMSRIINGKLRLDVQRVDLGLVLESAIEAIQPALEARGIRFQKVMDSMIGVVMGDPARLQQVFWNLLSNAVKFTPKGGRIQVVLERVNSHVEVSVIDTGIGIRPELLPHIFERFQQGDSSTTRRFGGLGLGLSIVKHLVELHGGAVRAKSQGEGKGSTFSVTLPVTVLAREPEPQQVFNGAAQQSAEGDCPQGLSGLKVLIVDDDPDSLAMVSRVLEMCECKVTTASSGAQAIDLLQSFQPDVLISDIGMPEEDGYSLLRKIRALPPASGGLTPAIALTAFARSDDRLKALNAGFQMHLSKPTESAELLAVVNSVARLKLHGR